jgi:hypothetical protein
MYGVLQHHRPGDDPMIENYFMEGVRFAWNMPAAVESGANRDGTVVDSVRAATAMTYVGLGDVLAPKLMSSHVSTLGLNKGMAIPYDWCDFTTGRTARKPLAGRDILTGPMSGCFITRYTSAGTNYVGHVGTVGVPAVDTLVKRIFGATMPQNATGFNPFQAWQVDMADVSRRHGKAIQFIALVTTGGDFYAIAMMPDSKSPGEWVCGGAKKVPGLSYAQLRQKLGILTMGVRG